MTAPSAGQVYLAIPICQPLKNNVGFRCRCVPPSRDTRPITCGSTQLICIVLPADKHSSPFLLFEPSSARRKRHGRASLAVPRLTSRSAKRNRLLRRTARIANDAQRVVACCVGGSRPEHRAGDHCQWQSAGERQDRRDLGFGRRRRRRGESNVHVVACEGARRRQRVLCRQRRQCREEHRGHFQRGRHVRLGSDDYRRLEPFGDGHDDGHREPNARRRSPERRQRAGGDQPHCAGRHHRAAPTGWGSWTRRWRTSFKVWTPMARSAGWT